MPDYKELMMEFYRMNMLNGNKKFAERLLADILDYEKSLDNNTNEAYNTCKE